MVVTVTLPEKYEIMVQDKHKELGFATQSEMVRAAIRILLDEYESDPYKNDTVSDDDVEKFINALEEEIKEFNQSKEKRAAQIVEALSDSPELVG